MHVTTCHTCMHALQLCMLRIMNNVCNDQLIAVSISVSVDHLSCYYIKCITFLKCNTLGPNKENKNANNCTNQLPVAILYICVYVLAYNEQFNILSLINTPPLAIFHDCDCTW